MKGNNKTYIKRKQQNIKIMHKTGKMKNKDKNKDK
jgi:hypothetical protein